ncbi:serine/threonine-protein kinase [Streptomyces sp. NPDC059740]|uniref:serine/threonine-protein kinase n=1 Tax=Streptomyces sp. NPDC059740 TaxID=3346926 RepID=UPI0036521CFE
MGDEGEKDGEKGRLLADRYRLTAVLGRGGMGTVWRARDEVLGRVVAVKELRFPGGVEEDEKRRLITRTLREAKAIARIRNNGAVTVYDVVDEDDRPWIVMELVEGRSLAEVIRDDGPLEPRRAAEVGLAVLDVLRAAHRESILHRDVKPSNVLMSDDGRVVLTDFGIAQVEGDPSVTSTGMLVGAPSYISPERARGQKPGPPADLWSLGGLLYACVEGVPPYDKGSAIATLTAVMTEPLQPPKRAGGLEKVIAGLLVKDPDKRLDDAGARALLTEALAEPEPKAAEPPADATRAMALPPAPATSSPAGAKASKATRSESGKAAQAGKAAAGGAAAAGAAEAAAKSRAKPSGAAPAASAADTAPPKAPGGGPAAPAPAGAGPAGVPRRVIAIAAVVLVLVVLGAVLVYTLGQGDDERAGRHDGKKATPTASGSPSGSAQATSQGGQGAESGASKDSSGHDSGDDSDGKASAGSSGDSEGSGDGKGGATVPDGYATVSDGDFHFTMALPKGWKRTDIAGQHSGGIYNAGKGEYPRVQVDYNSKPSNDAAAAWRSLEPAISSSSSNYHRISIKSVKWRGYPTVADWSFTRTQGGTTMRVLNRGFKVDAHHGYAIMISCPAADWSGAECTRLRETAFATFAVKD